MKRIYYTTNYDTTNRICGYIIPQHETDDYYAISRSQYRRCLRNRTVGGDAGINFLADKPVYVKEIDY